MRALKLAILLIVCIAAVHSAQFKVSALELNATNLMKSKGWDDGVAIVTANRIYGTGWWVERNVMITAAHVVEYQEGRVVTVVHGSFRTTGIVVKVDRDRDVAVIRTNDMPPNAYIFPLAREVRKTETIYVIGYPFELMQLERNIERLTENPRIARGTIAWIDPVHGIAEITAHTDAGNSGGPVVDSSGNVVGLVSFALIGRASTLYFITITPEIQRVLNTVDVEPQYAHLSPETKDTLKLVLMGVGSSVITALVILQARRR